jgi:hypothetical protein
MNKENKKHFPFYQPLFSILPSIILFPSKSFPNLKAQSKSLFPIFKGKKSPKAKSQSQAKSPKAQGKAPKIKSPSFSFRGLL